MSIWSSVPTDGGQVIAVDLHADGANEYTGTSQAAVDVDVAIAPSWHDRIRLSIDGDDVHACLALDDDAADRLAVQLEEARAEIRRRGEAPAPR